MYNEGPLDGKQWFSRKGKLTLLPYIIEINELISLLTII